MEAELSEEGFSLEATKGVASPVWILPDPETKLANPTEREKILQIAELLEDEPVIGQDFVCIARK